MSGVMREYLHRPECEARHVGGMRALRAFLKKHGLSLKTKRRIGGLGAVIGEFLIDPDPAQGGYYIHHCRSL